MKKKSEVRANRSAAKSEVQTQTITAAGPKKQTVRVSFPKAVFPVIDKAAAQVGKTRLEFITECAATAGQRAMEATRRGKAKPSNRQGRANSSGRPFL